MTRTVQSQFHASMSPLKAGILYGLFKESERQNAAVAKYWRGPGRRGSLLY
jgi:hypothetical protein